MFELTEAELGVVLEASEVVLLLKQLGQGSVLPAQKAQDDLEDGWVCLRAVRKQELVAARKLVFPVNDFPGHWMGSKLEPFTNYSNHITPKNKHISF